MANKMGETRETAEPGKTGETGGRGDRHAWNERERRKPRVQGYINDKKDLDSGCSVARTTASANLLSTALLPMVPWSQGLNKVKHHECEHSDNGFGPGCCSSGQHHLPLINQLILKLQ